MLIVAQGSRLDTLDYARARRLLAYETPAQSSVDDARAVCDRLDGFLGRVRPAGQLVCDSDGLGTDDGRTFRLMIGPGVVRVRSFDQARAERRLRLAVDDQARRADVLAIFGRDVAGARGREVTEWSARSRSRMLVKVAGLDLSAWADDDALFGMSSSFGMVTLTLPGFWRDVAPTGPAFKALVRTFTERYRRAFGHLRGIWKLEMQRRGAAHLHALMRVPTLAPSPFCTVCPETDQHGYPLALGYGRDVCQHWTLETWLSYHWTDVVGADANWCHVCEGYAEPDRAPAGVYAPKCLCRRADTERVRHSRAGTGVDFDTRKFSDPRRIAIYFHGHSAKSADGKEYQHVLPVEWQGSGAGPGRFWGVWGLRDGTAEVDVHAGEFDALERVLRAVARSREKRAYLVSLRYGKDRRVRTQAVKSYAGPCGRVLPGFEVVKDFKGGYWHRVPLRCTEVGPHSHVRRRKVRRLRAGRSLGASGGAGGGFLVVNDGIRLGLDLVRFLEARAG